jgi:hypothetical protein
MADFARGNATSFLEALALLLRRHELRRQFSENPQHVAELLGLSGADAETLAAIPVDGLEVQSRIILRKQFDSIRTFLPVAFKAMGDDAWRIFLERSQTSEWPSEDEQPELTAMRFSHWLCRTYPAAHCQREANRLEFLYQSECRFFVRMVRRQRGRMCLALQILRRLPDGQVSETLLSLC